MRVPARGDEGAFADQRAVRHGKAHGHLGGDVHVGQAAYAVAPKESAGPPRLPHDRRPDRGARFDVLEGIDLDVVGDHRVAADDRAVADHDPLCEVGVLVDLYCVAQYRPADRSPGGDVDVLSEDGVSHVRTGAKDGVVSQDGVREDLRPRFEAYVLAYDSRAFDVVERVQGRALRHPDVAAQPDPGRGELHLAVERIPVGLQVLLQAADVLPVSLADDAVERLLHIEELGEQVVAEVVLLALGDVVEDLGLDHVYAGVDRVGEDLAPARLLQEALDPALVVDYHHAELQGVGDALQRDGDGGLPLLVEGDHAAEVEVGERIAAYDKERLVQEVLGQADGPGSPRRGLFHRVVDAHAEAAAVAEVVADQPGQESQGHDHFVDTVPLEQLQDVLDGGLVHHRHHRLGLVRREGPQTGALTAGHDYCLHGSLLSDITVRRSPKRSPEPERTRPPLRVDLLEIGPRPFHNGSKGNPSTGCLKAQAA